MGSRILAALTMLSVWSCVGKAQDGTSGGNTSWLAHCSDSSDCAEGLCSRGVCTRDCASDDACEALGSDALCAPAEVGPSCASSEQVCTRSCEQNADCSELGDDFTCVGGACVAQCAGAEPDASESEPAESDPATADAGPSCAELGFPEGEFFGECNNCFCEDGQSYCDEGCPSGTCESGGVVHENGAVWGACNQFGCVDGQVSSNPIDCQACEYEGEIYDNGASFGACGECTCEGGSVTCSEECPDCEVEGVVVPYGESYPADDACNDCTCGGGCTQRACAQADRCVYEGQLIRSGEIVAPCSLCSCRDGEIVCADEGNEPCDAGAPTDDTTTPSINPDLDAGDVVYGAQLDGGQCVLVDGVAVMSIELAKGYIPIPTSGLADYDREWECGTELSEVTTMSRTTNACGQIVYQTEQLLEQPAFRTARYVFDAESGALLSVEDEHAVEWGPCGVNRYEIGEEVEDCVLQEGSMLFCQPAEHRDGG